MLTLSQEGTCRQEIYASLPETAAQQAPHHYARLPCVWMALGLFFSSSCPLGCGEATPLAGSRRNSGAFCEYLRGIAARAEWGPSVCPSCTARHGKDGLAFGWTSSSNDTVKCSVSSWSLQLHDCFFHLFAYDAHAPFKKVNFKLISVDSIHVVLRMSWGLSFACFYKRIYLFFKQAIMKDKFICWGQNTWFLKPANRWVIFLKGYLDKMHVQTLCLHRGSRYVHAFHFILFVTVSTSHNKILRKSCFLPALMLYSRDLSYSFFVCCVFTPI